MGCTDEWSGFADLLANLIGKYATDLNLKDFSETKNEENNKTTVEAKQTG